MNHQRLRRTYFLFGLLRRRKPHQLSLNQSYSTTTTSKGTTAAAGGLILGIPLTAYLIYRAKTQPAYPDAIQQQLRQALIAEHRADHRKSDILFRQAYEQSKHLVRSGDLDWFKSSAIAITWAASLEKTARTDRAIEVYQLAFDDLRLALPGLSIHERLRTIEIAQRLGQLLIHSSFQSGKKPNDLVEMKIEEYLVFSVEEILKIQNKYKNKNKNSNNDNNIPLDSDHLLHLSDQYEELFESLPSWVGRLQFASCFEALGKLYAQRGQIDFALPLYLQTLNLLLPSQLQSDKKWNKMKGPADEERCQAATVMNNIGQMLFAHSETDPEAGGDGERLRLNAAQWLSQSSALARRVLEAHHQLPALNGPRPLGNPPAGFLVECREAFIAANANLNSLNRPPASRNDSVM